MWHDDGPFETNANTAGLLMLELKSNVIVFASQSALGSN